MFNIRGLTKIGDIMIAAESQLPVGGGCEK